jgi:hypothetical protein
MIFWQNYWWDANVNDQESLLYITRSWDSTVDIATDWVGSSGFSSQQG